MIFFFSCLLIFGYTDYQVYPAKQTQVQGGGVPSTIPKNIVPYTESVTTQVTTNKPITRMDQLPDGVRSVPSNVIEGKVVQEETVRQEDYLKLIVTEQNLPYIRMFVTVTVSVLFSFILTLPFGHFESFKFMGVEYKERVREKEKAAEVAASTIDLVMEAELARLTALSSFAGVDLSPYIKGGIEAGIDKQTLLFECFQMFCELLEANYGATEGRISVSVEVVRAYRKKVPDAMLVQIRNAHMYDVVVKACKKQQSVYWEVNGKEFFFAMPVFLSEEREDDFLLVSMYSSKIQFNDSEEQTFLVAKEIILQHLANSSQVVAETA